MKKKKTRSGMRGIRIAGIFSVSVIAVISIAILIRVVFLYYERTFDGEHRYTLLIKENPNAARIISFEPNTSSISMLQITTTPAHSNIGKELEIPIDARFTDVQKENEISLSRFLWYATWNIRQFKPSGINNVDAFLLLSFIKKTHTKDISQDSISLPYVDLMQHLPKLFSDHTIYQENLTITIINASNISGIGNRLARYLTNIGCNIIAVTTADQIQDNSTIASLQKTSYTYKKTQSLLKLSENTIPQNALSDIIITIGRKSQSDKF